ncbi:MAG: adenylosuccinate synthase [Oscillospiraceae bacterium]|jgi:adenylosuccinate synthase|nr:adenylosuccinate synthase [Oscillospiraceae bacterium]
MVTVVVGAQFGDEGKGKMVDYLAADADLVVRYQGGDNAGHTVINSYGVFKMHLIPCGIFTPGASNLVGTGTVVNPDVLISEIDMLKELGVDVSKLYLSDKAHLILPYHVELDVAIEKASGIGTTKRGIGQAYAYKMLRKNPRAEDLRDLDVLKEYISQAKSAGLANLNYDVPDEKLRYWQERLVPLLVDPVEFVNDYIDSGKHVLFEGQLGVMKDIDLGTYPYVTSSNPVAAYAAVSGGFPVSKITRVAGVAKAFSSDVGDGPFPTEMTDDEAAPLRGDGSQPDDEFGARTGRSRRLGWLDLEVLRYAHKVNGLTELILTKLDKLDGVEQLKVCTSYVKGSSFPIYKMMPGWTESTKGIKDYDKLPANAKAYIELIEKQVGVKVRYIGTGPARDDVVSVSR